LFTFLVSHRNRCSLHAIQLGITDRQAGLGSATDAVVDKAAGVDNQQLSL
jgi:hypothetical protein